MLLDFNIDVETITYFEDNQGCIALVKNPCNNRRVKQLDLKFNFVCESFKNCCISLIYVEIESQETDILTKGLPGTPFSRIKYNIGLRDFSEGGC